MQLSLKRALRTSRRLCAVSAAVLFFTLTAGLTAQASGPSADHQRVDVAKATQTMTTQAAGYKCRTVTHSVVYKTTLGLKAFTWTAKARWCYNGSKIRHVSHSSYLSANNGFNVLRSPSVDRQFWGDSRHKTAIVEVAGHVQNCIPKVGCIASYYPYAYMTLKASGGHSWSTHR